jgi:hypothetical protein
MIRYLRFFRNKIFIFKLLLFLSPCVILFNWFSSGNMLAIGEEGLPFYNLQRTLHLYSSYFYDTGLGVSSIFNIPRIPLYTFGYILQQIGLHSWHIQLIVLLVLMLVSLFSMNSFVKEVLETNNEELGFSASMFYLFNVYTLSQVWSRFILPLVFLWAYIPLFLLLFLRYLKTDERKYLYLFALSSIPFSVAYVIISPALTLWLCAGLLVFLFLFTSKKRIQLLSKSFIAFILWIVVNIWWIFPLVTLNDGATSSGINADQNLLALSDVSSYFPNTELLRLRQLYMLGPNSPNYNFYNSAIVGNVSWIIFAVVLFGIYYSLRQYIHTKNASNQNGLLFFFLLFILGWFISKGSNPPFGQEFYKFIFENISIFQIFRNPYEKFGIVFLFGYAVFFAFGIEWFKSKFLLLKHIVFTLFLLLSCVYLVKPMWASSLFKNTTYLEVPSYYELANKYINQNTNIDSRILHLPYLHGSGIKYDWNYAGEEPSEFLFDHASVSRTLSNSLIDEFYTRLHDPKFFKDNTNFPNILSVINVESIVLHKDLNTDVTDKNLVLTNLYDENVDDTRKIIISWKDVGQDKDLGQLELYSLHHDQSRSRVYLSDNLIQTSNIGNAFETFSDSSFTPFRDSLFVTSQNSLGYPSNSLEIPEHETQRISASQYEIKITDSTEPYILILSNNYSNAWTAKVESNSLTSHFIVNGFANGWLVDKKGDYTIEIKFKVWPWE